MPCFPFSLAVTATCEPPERLQYAELEESFSTMNSFPVGSTVSYICRPGYMGIAGKSLTRTCGKDLQWSPTEKFCTGNACMSSDADSLWYLRIRAVFQVRIRIL